MDPVDLDPLGKSEDYAYFCRGKRFMSDGMFKNRVAKLWEKVKPYCNKYIIVTVFFIVMILFVGEGNIFHRIRYDREIHALNDEIERYETQRDASKKRLDGLRIGEGELEKTAREQYLMKKDDEDVFLLEHR